VIAVLLDFFGRVSAADFLQTQKERLQTRLFHEQLHAGG